MLRKRTVRESSKRCKYSTHSFRVHDEWSHVVFWIRVCLEVRHIVTNPFLLFFVPPHLATLRIPGLAGRVARRAVVHNATIRRPRPGPVGIDSQARWILSAAPLCLRTCFRPGTRVQPVAACGGPIVTQPGKAGYLLTCF